MTLGLFWAQTTVPHCYRGSGDSPYLTKETRSERDSNPRYRLTRYTAFPGLGRGVPGGASAGTAYTDFSSRGHHEASEGTLVGPGLTGTAGLRRSATAMPSSPAPAVFAYEVRASSGCVDTFWRCGRAPANDAATEPVTMSGVPMARGEPHWDSRSPQSLHQTTSDSGGRRAGGRRWHSVSSRRVVADEREQMDVLGRVVLHELDEECPQGCIAKRAQFPAQST